MQPRSCLPKLLLVAPDSRNLGSPGGFGHGELQFNDAGIRVKVKCCKYCESSEESNPSNTEENEFVACQDRRGDHDDNETQPAAYHGGHVPLPVKNRGCSLGNSECGQHSNSQQPPPTGEGWPSVLPNGCPQLRDLCFCRRHVRRGYCESTVSLALLSQY